MTLQGGAAPPSDSSGGHLPASRAAGPGSDLPRGGGRGPGLSPRPPPARPPPRGSARGSAPGRLWSRPARSRPQVRCGRATRRARPAVTAAGCGSLIQTLALVGRGLPRPDSWTPLAKLNPKSFRWDDSGARDIDLESPQISQGVVLRRAHLLQLFKNDQGFNYLAPTNLGRPRGALDRAWGLHAPWALCSAHTSPPEHCQRPRFLALGRLSGSLISPLVPHPASFCREFLQGNSLLFSPTSK
jgi:hypothetical protein